MTLRAARILCIGGANLDIKCRLQGPATGNSDPALIETSAGGVARNVAHNLSLLGHKVELITALQKGDTAIIERSGAVDFSHAHRSDLPSGTYCAMLDRDGELIQAASDMRVIETLTPEIVDTCWDDRAEFVFADNNLPIETLLSLRETAEGLPVLIDAVSIAKAKKITHLLSHFPFMLTANRKEMEVICGQEIRDDHHLRQACHDLHHMGISAILVGLGKEGAFLSLGSEQHFVPRHDGNIKDVTGAGDAATAGFLHGLIQHWLPLEAAQFGQKMAALACASASSIAEGLEKKNDPIFTGR